MFHVIQDAHCILRTKRSVYKQAKVYKYKDGLYVGVPGGYVRLMRNGDVATPDLSYIELVLPEGLAATHDNLQRLTIKPQEESTK